MRRLRRLSRRSTCKFVILCFAVFCLGPTSLWASPTVAITSPAAGSTVEGETWIDVSFRGEAGAPVAAVRLYVDGRQVQEWKLATPIAEGRQSFKWNFSLDTRQSHTLSARAVDSRGRESSTELTVRVQQARVAGDRSTPPVVKIVYPTDGARVHGNVRLRAEASGSAGVTAVFFYIDGKLKSMIMNAPPWVSDWDTTRLPDGPHVVEAMVFDGNDNEARSPRVTVFVQNREMTADESALAAEAGLAIPAGLPPLPVAESLPAADPPPVIQAPAQRALAPTLAEPGTAAVAATPPAGERQGSGPGLAALATSPAPPSRPSVVTTAPPSAGQATHTVAALPPSAGSLPALSRTTLPSARIPAALAPAPVAPAIQPVAPAPPAPAPRLMPSSGGPQLAPVAASVPGPAPTPVAVSVRAPVAPSVPMPVRTAPVPAPRPAPSQSSWTLPAGRSSGGPSLVIAPQPQERAAAELRLVVVDQPSAPARPSGSSGPQLAAMRAESPAGHTGPGALTAALPAPRGERVSLPQLPAAAPAPSAAAMPAASGAQLAMLPASQPSAPTESARIATPPSASRAPAVVGELREVQIVLDGRCLELRSLPEVQQGVSLAPLREIFEGTDGKLYWFAQDKRVQAINPQVELSLQIGLPQAQVNGQSQPLELAPYIKNGRTMVPLQFLADTLDMTIIVNPDSGQIVLSSNRF